jgi:hypothetical protein
MFLPQTHARKIDESKLSVNHPIIRLADPDRVVEALVPSAYLLSRRLAQAPLQSDFPAHVHAVLQRKSPRQMSGAPNSDAFIGNHVDRASWFSKTIFLILAQIHFMMTPGDRKRLRQFARPGAKPVQIMNSTAPSH